MKLVLQHLTMRLLTGHSKDAAKYAGMNAKRNIILSLVISGAIAGLAASLYYLTGIEHYKISSSVPQMGFSGIAVAFLGGLNPIGAIFTVLREPGSLRSRL